MKLYVSFQCRRRWVSSVSSTRTLQYLNMPGKKLSISRVTFSIYPILHNTQSIIEFPSLLLFFVYFNPEDMFQGVAWYTEYDSDFWSYDNVKYDCMSYNLVTFDHLWYDRARHVNERYDHVRYDIFSMITCAMTKMWSVESWSFEVWSCDASEVYHFEV